MTQGFLPYTSNVMENQGWLALQQNILVNIIAN